MKKVFMSFLCAALVFFLVACSGKGESGADDRSPVKDGAYVDKVIYMASMDQSVALKDVIEGKADVLFTEAPSVLLRGLSEEERDKIEVYPVPSSYWSLLVNPIPNAAPYTWKSQNTGEEIFNPFAVKEIRFAMNWLINRKKLIDEIMLGEGSPMYTPCIQGLPGTYKYNLLPTQFGITDTGDEEKALSIIQKEMDKIAQLPQLKGVLVQEKGKWLYKGKPVTIKSIARADDPNARLPAIRYINSQLEKAGFTIQSIERDRKTASSVVYSSDPAELQWSMYLEGWVAGGTNKFYYTALSQMYAPFYTNMPGNGDTEFWNYKNDAIDVYGKKAAYGQFLTADDYWDGTLKLASLGLQDAVRVFVASTNSMYIANKARLNSRLFYGLGDGFNGWTIRLADVKKDTDGPYKGLRVLRVMQYSAVGSLFMSEWDPVGTHGFSDSYSSAVLGALTDLSFHDNPCTADYEFGSSSVNIDDAKFAPKLIATGKKTDTGDDEYEMSGDISVPENAVWYDSGSKKWLNVKPGTKAAVASTGRLKEGYFWHTGEAVDLNDVRYAMAFQREWSTKDSADDQYYDIPFDSLYTPDLKTSKGVVFNEDGSVTAYSNYYFAADIRETALVAGAVSGKAGNPGRRTYLPWEIYEACSEIVVNGSRSGTVYNFTKDGGQRGVEVNVISAECVADIKAKLQEFADNNHVPVSLEGFIQPQDAVKRYNASISFIDNYGHAYISNGPLMIEKIDTITASIICNSVKNYPYKSDFYEKLFKTDVTVINYVQAPSAVTADKDAVYEATVAKYTYPELAQEPLINGKVEAKLQLPSGREKLYLSEGGDNGIYRIVIPSSDLAELEKGMDYTLVIFSQVGKEPPATKAVTLSLLK